MTLTSEDKDYNARHIKELQAEIEKLRAELQIVGERRDWYAGEATDAKGVLATANADICALRVEVAELKARLERAEKSGTGQPNFFKIGG